MKKTLGIKHIALKVQNFEECLIFYTNILGMNIDWQPDKNNAYLSNGSDNLALHKDDNLEFNEKNNRLDHFGIMLIASEDVDEWFVHMQSKSVPIHKEIKNHRDGSRSFYCLDPDKNIIQFLWHPEINKL